MQRLTRWSMACAVFIGAGTWCWGGSAHAQSPAQAIDPAQTAQHEQSLSAADQAASSGPWQVLTRSFEQRVIEYRQFGRGEPQILVVGPLEGDEPAGVELLERLVDHLERFPRRLDGVTVTVVRDPNPDGRLRGSRTNARGVRLDMNFPTRQWRKVPLADRWLSGRTPESEPETRALIELLDDLKPRRIMLLEATRREPELRYSATAEPIARRLATVMPLRPTAWDAAVVPASLATYAGSDRNLATLVLRVPAAAGADYNWTQYKRALLAAVEAEAIEPEANAPHRLAAFTRGRVSLAAPAASQPEQSEATERRVLSAKDLELGGVLVPVARQPRAASSPSAHPSVSTQPTPGGPRPAGPPSRSIVPYRGLPIGSLPKNVPTGQLGTPVPYATINRLRGSAARSGGNPPPSQPRVERLPAVDPNQPPVKPLPQPIPLYPETGY